MNVVVCTLFVATFGWALASNADKFSPAKVFLFSTMVFYGGILAFEASVELWLLVMLVLLVGLASTLFEIPYRSGSVAAMNVRTQRPLREKYFVPWIWVLSAPALLSQIYIVQLFGGIEGYINIIGLRVVELRGLGWAKTMISTMMVLNLIYFAVGLTRPRRTTWWTTYLVHLSMLLVIGALSGSRTALLNVFVLQLFTFHYLRGPVRTSRAVVLGGTLLASAMIIGVVREGIKIEEDTLRTGLEDSEQVLQLSAFRSGVLPLQILLDADALHLAYGSTFLPVITNVVPRQWWPGKPDTGGVFFTEEYTGNAWEGASYLTPTFLGEAIINFGWIFGAMFFFIVYVSLMYFVVSYYRRTMRRMRTTPNSATAIDLVVYLFVMWSIIALTTGEATNVLVNLALTQVIPAFAIKAVLRIAR